VGALVTLIQNLPAILALITSVEKALQDAKNEAQVKDGLAKVKEAFDAKDSSKLDALFNK
jgi:hypothetical protein